MALIGVVDRRGRTGENAQFVALVDLCRRFEAKSSHFFDAFDSLIVLTINFAHMPTSRDLAISVLLTMTTTTTERSNRLLYPLHMRVG